MKLTKRKYHKKTISKHKRYTKRKRYSKRNYKGGKIEFIIKKSSLDPTKTVGQINTGNDFPLDIDERLKEMTSSITKKNLSDVVFTKIIRTEKNDNVKKKAHKR